MSDVEATIQRYFTCLDTEDWDGMREIWHQDGELRAVGARPRRGVDEVIGYFSGLFGPWPRHTDIPTRLIVAGDTVTAEVRFEGTTPDGKDVTFEAVDLFDLEGGRIKRLSNWYDIAYVRKTLAG
jgi:ketosteroid isomerase-like protein